MDKLTIAARRGKAILRIAAAAALLLAAAGSARADAVSDIKAVIEDQIAAFAAGDAHRAFAHASPGIQAQMGSSATFMLMVESGYSALIGPKAFEILDVVEDGDTAAAHARVIAADGRAYEALYPLKRQANGQWRIDGCHLRPARGQSL